MKYALGIILISATLAIIVMGSFMMYHDLNGHTQCPISALASNTCINITDPFETAISHLNAIINISIGITSWPAALSLILALSMFLFFSLSIDAKQFKNNLLAYVKSADKNQPSTSKLKWLSWLSVLEKRAPWKLSAAKM